MPVTIKTNTGGGSVTLDAGTGSSDTTLTLPNTSGTLLQSGTAVTVAQGGTGVATLTANAVLIGNGTSAVTAIAPSTAGNILTSTGSAWASSAPAATASLTLLATLTTTSGTTQSATGLATTYTNLVIVYEGVGNSTGSNILLIKASSTNGAAYGAAKETAASSPSYGMQFIWRANSSITNHPAPTAGEASSANSLAFLATNTAAPINALQFSWNNGYTFNAGTIYIYGWN